MHRKTPYPIKDKGFNRGLTGVISFKLLLPTTFIVIIAILLMIL
jgi:hypothetical protein